MDPKNHKKRKLSAIVRDKKGIEDRALLLILLSVLLVIVIGIIVGAISGVGKSVDKAQGAGDEIIDHYKEMLTKDSESESP